MTKKRTPKKAATKKAPAQKKTMFKKELYKADTPHVPLVKKPVKDVKTLDKGQLPRIRTSNKSGTYMSRCHFCEDLKGHCEVDVIKHLFFCHRCGVGGKVTGMVATDSSIIRFPVPETMNSSCEGRVRMGGSVPSTHTIWDYLRGRGMSDKMIKGLDPRFGESWKVHFPLLDIDGDIVYLVGRSYHDGQRMKWEYPAGVPGKSSFLWGMHRVPKKGGDLVLVEGIFDAVWDSNRLAILGCTLSSAQLELIKSLKPKTLTVCLDGDARLATLRIAEQILKSYTVKLYVSILDSDMDPDDLQEEGTLEISRRAERVL